MSTVAEDMARARLVGVALTLADHVRNGGSATDYLHGLLIAAADDYDKATK